MAHSVHVEVDGLDAGREYFYRFRAGGFQSPSGRALTLPPPGMETAATSFATVGCQRWEYGHFTALKHLADEYVDFVFHSGDYIYEYGQIKEDEPEGRKFPVIRRMPQDYGLVTSLTEYRNRFALYKTDPALQLAHAASPFVVSFDDHDVRDGWSGDFLDAGAEYSAAFLKRRAAAFRAWYEHMPLRRAQRPKAAEIQAYRRFRIGDLATINVLDTRQYRTPPPCGRKAWQPCENARAPGSSMLGARQEQWLIDDLRSSGTRWNVLAQQVMMMQWRRKAEGGIQINTDQWDGAEDARARLLGAAADSNASGLVIVSGDIHSNCAGDLRRNFDAEGSPATGVEFVGTSISSGGDGSDNPASLERMRSLNPHISFFNNQRGYVVHTVTRESWEADFRVVEKVSVPDSPIKTRKVLVSERRNPGIRGA
jgi:alkaline phosphatase D